MIRRSVTEGRFLLISQTEHARIAWEFARAWQSSAFRDYPWLTELLFAIRHHDDGWSEWEKTADVTPDSGLPRNFTEMDAATSTSIWRSSIAICAERSQRCGFWVSQHFSALAKQRLQSLDADFVDESSSLQTFVQQQDHQIQARQDNGDRLITTGTSWLQFFDRLSLLVCCRFTAETEVMTQPDGIEVSIVQQQTRDGITLRLNAQITPMTLQVNGRQYEKDRTAFALNRLPAFRLRLNVE